MIRDSASRRALPRWRALTGMTQTALSLELKLDRTGLNHIEAGRAQPSLQCAIRIERLTGGVVPCLGWETGT